MFLLAAACLGAGCAQPAANRADAPAKPRQDSPSAMATVFPSPGQRYALSRQAAEPPSESWAFARKDDALAVRSSGPLLATRQWPEPPPPCERPVRFKRWVQH